MTALDGFLNMSGRLSKNIEIESYFEETNPKDVLQFEDIYNVLCKWGTDPNNTSVFEGFI